MNKTIKKFILSMLILIFAFGTISYAEEAKNIELKIVEKSDNYKKWEKLSDEERNNAIEPLYFNVNIDKSIKKSTYNQLLKVGASTAIGDKYDLRTTLKDKISVRNQEKTGSCWAFSYVTALETTLAKNSNENLKFSPMHIDYRTSQMFSKNVGDGGNAFLGLAYSADGYGPVYESELPFESVYNEKTNSSPYYLSNIENVKLDQSPKARVNDATIFASIYKDYSGGNITYKSGDGTPYTEEEVNVIRNSIKEHIEQDGAISAVIYMKMQKSDAGYIDVDGYYNKTNNSFYCNNSSVYPNHAITIVGWDDTYSKDNFTHKPIHDGAYIVLNSYGTNFGDKGYCYVSYDDAVIEQLLVGIDSIEAYNKENPKVSYDNIYQYDELGMATALNFRNELVNSMYAANIFNRKNTQTIEYISEVGLYLYETEGVEIYVVPADNGLPSSSELGSPVASYSGGNALQAGYHVVKLASPVKLTGNKFAVVVKYIRKGGPTIPIECDLYSSGLSSATNYWDKATSNAGESYLYELIDWADIKDYKIGNRTLVNTNFCIKAFTTNLDEKEIKVTGVKLNEKNHTMTAGEEFNLVATITPENATNKNVTWTSSNEEVATVSKTGIIKALKAGTTTITVKTRRWWIYNNIYSNGKREDKQ